MNLKFLWQISCNNYVSTHGFYLILQSGISSSAALSRRLEIYKSDEAREAVRDIKDGDTLLVGGI